MLKSYLTKKTSYGFIFGPSFSGKTTLARYTAQRYGYTVIEWEPTIAMLKEKLAVNPGEPLEDVSFDKIIGYYKKLIGNYTSDVFLFDGLPPNVDFKQL